MLVCLSPNGSTVHHGREAPDRLLVGTSRGVAVLQRSGSRWSATEQALPDSHISCLYLEQSSGRVLAGAHTGGLFASEYGRGPWSPVSPEFDDLNVYTVASWRGAGTDVRWYVGVEPAALYRSFDGTHFVELASLQKAGDTSKWTFPGPPHYAHVKNIVVDPAGTGTIYVGIEQGGLFRSRDWGDSWSELDGVALNSDHVYRDIHRLLLVPSRPARLMVTTGDGFKISDDGGESFRLIDGAFREIAYPDALLMAPDDESELYVAGASYPPDQWRTVGRADASVVRSRDGGRTWTPLRNGLPGKLTGNIEAMSLATWPGGLELFFGTTAGEVYSSADRGNTWQPALIGLAPISKTGHFRVLAEAGAS